jgi:hypothetical protein
MAARLVLLFLVLAVMLPAAKKTVGTARGENQDLILNVTIYTDAAGVKELIGDDLGSHYIVAQVKVEPKYGKDIAIDRDDFQLRTDKDGERTKPRSANAGRGLVFTRTGGPRSGEERPRVSIGGGIGMGGGALGLARATRQRQGHDGKRRQGQPAKEGAGCQNVAGEENRSAHPGPPTFRWNSRSWKDRS